MIHAICVAGARRARSNAVTQMSVGCRFHRRIRAIAIRPCTLTIDHN